MLNEREESAVLLFIWSLLLVLLLSNWRYVGIPFLLLLVLVCDDATANDAKISKWLDWSEMIVAHTQRTNMLAASYHPFFFFLSVVVSCFVHRLVFCVSSVLSTFHINFTHVHTSRRPKIAGDFHSSFFFSLISIYIHLLLIFYKWNGIRGKSCCGLIASKCNAARIIRRANNNKKKQREIGEITFEAFWITGRGWKQTL